MRIIKNHDELNYLQWSQFVTKHEHGNVFQSPEFYFAVLESRDWIPSVIAIVDDNENLAGVLVSMMQKEGLGPKAVLTSRTIVWGGPLVSSHQCMVPILNRFDEESSRNSLYSQFRNLFPMNGAMEAFRMQTYNYSEHLDILVPIDMDPGKIFQGIHGERRHNIRRAIKKGLEFGEVTNEQQLNESYELIGRLYERMHFPLPSLMFFQAFYRRLHRNGIFRAFIALLNGKIISTRFVLCYGQVMYDWYAASDRGHLGCYPNDFLPWKVMEWGANNGFKLFDFGGAGRPGESYGVRDYKLKFGGQLVNYGRFEKIHKPMLYRTAKTGFHILQKIKR